MKLFVLISTDYLICLLPSFTNIFHSQMNAVYMKKWITRGEFQIPSIVMVALPEELSPSVHAAVLILRRINKKTKQNKKQNKTKTKTHTQKKKKWKNRDIVKKNIIETDIHHPNMKTTLNTNNTSLWSMHSSLCLTSPKLVSRVDPG